MKNNCLNFLSSDMKQVPLQCNCQLNSFVAFLTRAVDTKVLGTCEDTKERLIDLKGRDLCGNLYLIVNFNYFWLLLFCLYNKLSKNSKL